MNDRTDPGPDAPGSMRPGPASAHAGARSDLAPEPASAALSEALTAARNAVPAADRCAIHLLDGADLVVRATDPRMMLGPRAARTPSGDEVIGRVVSTGRAVHLADLTAGGPAGGAVSAGARSLLGAPIHAGDRLIGVLQADADDGGVFTQEDADALQRVADALGAGLIGAPGVGPVGVLEPQGAPGAEPAGAPAVESGPPPGDPDDALALVSHELRRPLTALRGLAETLAIQIDRLDAAMTRTLAERIAAAAGRLDRLVGDLETLSRSGSGRLEVESEPMAIEPIIVDLAEDPQARHALAVDLEPGLPRIMADPVRVRQIIGNLLSNAARFSPPETTVRIAVYGSGDGVEVAVSDEGPGIPSEHLDDVFRPFFRLPRDRSTGPPGLGIGLALVRDLAGAMGGRVGIRSREGGGATFTVRFPVVRND